MAKIYKLNKQELPDMPERDDLGKEAIYYIELLEDSDRIKTELQRTKEKLCNLFRASGRESLNINGKVISYNHVEKNILRIIKAK